MAELDVLDVVEICAGAGGQALGLEQGFEHALAVELDYSACGTLRANRPAWKVAEGDVADRDLWRPEDYRGVALLAGGVPCPPFTVAGRQLGATDERDLFAWAVELCGIIRPRALLLENVRGLSTSRSARTGSTCWIGCATSATFRAGGCCTRRLACRNCGRIMLVAVRSEDAPWFHWPTSAAGPPATVGNVGDLMAARGWTGAPPGRAAPTGSRRRSWAAPRSTAAPTWARPGPSAPGPSSAWTASGSRITRPGRPIRRPCARG